MRRIYIASPIGSKGAIMPTDEQMDMLDEKEMEALCNEFMKQIMNRALVRNLDCKSKHIIFAPAIREFDIKSCTDLWQAMLKEAVK